MKIDFSEIKEDIVPEGFYNFVVSSVDEKISKAGHEMLSFRYSVVDGPYQNMCIFEFFLPKHAICGNSHASKLMKLCIACGITEALEHESQLLDKFFQAELYHSKDKDGKTRENLRNFLPYTSLSIAKSISSCISKPKSTVEKDTFNFDDIPF